MASEHKTEANGSSNTIICKSTLSDSFLLYLIKESTELKNIRPYEHQYLQNNKKFHLNKHILIELYLGLQRLIKRNKIKKWRKASTDVSKSLQHETYRPLISKLVYTLTLTLCDIPTIPHTANNHTTSDDAFINAFYDEIASIHRKASSLNTKTRMLYLREPYNFGSNNVDFSSVQTQKHFEIYQEISKRNGLSNNQNPFENFKFSLDIQTLVKLKRRKCVYCGKSSALYCAYCQYPFYCIDDDSDKWPNLTLPVHVDIIRHPKELVNVCSSVHACIVAPQFVQMYEFPTVPALSEEDGVYLLYPSEKAVFLDEVDDLKKIKKIVVIESRWRGNTPIYQHEELRNLPHCKIRNRETLYWRYQEKSKEYLATSEAIYYGVVDCWKAQNKNKEYDGRYDDLLLLFAHEHAKICNRDGNKKKKSFWTVCEKNKFDK